MVRTVVVARYASVRAGLRSLLADSVGVSVVGEVGSAADLATIATLRPEAILIELEALDSHDALDEVARFGLPVVVLGSDDGTIGALTARELPGWGLLTRGADGSELAAAIRAVSAGLVVIEPGLLPALAPSRELAEGDGSLSTREREVLQLVAEGLPNKQIALRLGISPHTAKFHVAGVLQKLGAASRTEAVSTGLRRGLVSL